MQNVVESFEREAPPSVHWPEASKVFAEMEREMLVWRDTCTGKQVEEGSEVRMHMKLVLSNLVFVDAVKTR